MSRDKISGEVAMRRMLSSSESSERTLKDLGTTQSCGCSMRGRFPQDKTRQRAMGEFRRRSWQT